CIDVALMKPKVLTENEITEMLTKVTEEELAECNSHILTPLKEIVLASGTPGGAIVYDIHGNEYLDCTSQAWTLNVGYVHPDVIYATQFQAERLTHVRYGYPTIPRIKLVNKLAQIAPGQLKKVSIQNQGGSTAIEAAMKLSMIHKPGASLFVTHWLGYHGATLATITASNWMPNPLIRFPCFGLQHFVKAPYPYCYRCRGNQDPKDCDLECLQYLRNLLMYGTNTPVAGVIVEPMQGPGGQVVAPQRYIEGIRQLCNELHVALIFDESQTAFGRVGKMFASEIYKVTPDLMALTKALGGGLPIGATLADKKFEIFTPAEEHSTFGSSPLIMAAALINLEVIQRLNLPRRAEKIGAHITKRLREIQKKSEHIGDIRGPGLFIGIEMVRDRKDKVPANSLADAIVREGLKRGVIYDLSMPFMRSLQFQRNVVKIKPPLIITEEEADRAVDVFDESLAAALKDLRVL
ncbi:MAG: aspartate aminotransferase family protein, partial [Candidatus Thorarchaeota archaeon]